MIVTNSCYYKLGMYFVTNISLTDTLLEGSTIEVVLAKPVDKNEYIRYTRGKNSIPQVSFKLILHSVSYLSMGALTVLKR